MKFAAGHSKQPIRDVKLRNGKRPGRNGGSLWFPASAPEDIQTGADDLDRQVIRSGTLEIIVANPIHATEKLQKKSPKPFGISRDLETYRGWF